ncbi:recombination protein RecR [bacterium]|nr:recombination protein RecR [bacterium]
MTLSAVKSLIEQAKKLPGLTHRQAEKLVYSLLSDNKIINIIDNFSESAKKLKQCNRCGWFVDQASSDCENCGTKTDAICVVPTFSDMLNIQRTGAFSGSYHILGGVVSPLEDILPENLLIKALVTRAQDTATKELILAFPDSIEAEATLHYIIDAIGNINVIVSRFSRGIPSSSKIEYMDKRTVSLAFSERKPINHSIQS